MSKIYHYFVEGECEKKLIDELKVSPINYFKAGKVEVYNFINKKITPQRLMSLDKKATIILVYDIDVKKINVLNDNISLLKKYGFNNIIHIQSINNFEDEIVNCTKINNINEFFHTKNVDEFKNKFIHQYDLYSKLKMVEFDKNKIWSKENKKEPFNIYYSKEFQKIIKK